MGSGSGTGAVGAIGWLTEMSAFGGGWGLALGAYARTGVRACRAYSGVRAAGRGGGAPQEGGRSRGA
ncbi:hypothetical protein, partial [Streptomyces odonnellii]|uniref:hypothetical protein n=1 Tax=Streptomyces odonnellii TaxID=1417980 RepID=UPI001E4E87A6